MTALVGYAVLILCVLGWLWLEWVQSAPDRLQRQGKPQPPRKLEDLPPWRLWLLAVIAWLAKPFPFREPGRLGAYREMVKGE